MLLVYLQEKFYQQQVLFNTKAPKESINSGVEPYKFAVTLFKQEDEDKTIVYNQPVGSIIFNPQINDFDFDKDYTKSISNSVAIA